MSNEADAAKQYAEAQARHTSLLAAFERSLRITDELYQRLERELYSPLGKNQYNGQLAKDVIGLSRALAQAGAVHARLLNDEAARAQSLSAAEKVRYMVQALKQLPQSARDDVIRELRGP